MKNKIFMGVGLAALFGVTAVLSHIFFWSKPDWQTNADSAATGTDESGYPWIGAKNPKLVIHEYLDYECPHCSGAHKLLRSHIARHLDEIRLVRHDYARGACEIQLGENLIKNCPLVRAAICASEKMSFWKWNDAVIAQPRHETNIGVGRYVKNMLQKTKLPEDDFKMCFNGNESSARAQKIYKATQDANVNATPTYIVDGKKMSLEGVLNLLDNEGY